MVLIFLIRFSSDVVSLTPTTTYPWNIPSWESIDMLRRLMSRSLLITDDMLVTMPMSSIPIMLIVAPNCSPILPDQACLYDAVGVAAAYVAGVGAVLAVYFDHAFR